MADQRRREPHEHRRVVGGIASHLFAVRSVVDADAEDAWADDRRQQADVVDGERLGGRTGVVQLCERAGMHDGVEIDVAITEGGRCVGDDVAHRYPVAAR